MALIDGWKMRVYRNTLADGTGTWKFLCGMQTNSWQMTRGTKEITLPDCTNIAQPQVTTQTEAIKYALSGNGYFTDDTDRTVRAAREDMTLGRAWTYKIEIDQDADYVAQFKLSDFTFNGNIEDYIQYSIAAAPSGAVTITNDV